MADDNDVQDYGAGEPTMDAAAAPASADPRVIPEDEAAMVKKIIGKIRADKSYHKKAFDRMRDDMYIALHGHERNYPSKSYKANLIGRYIRHKTGALYAKNPSATARQRESMDFAVWDEMPDSLALAFQTVQHALQAQVAAAAPQPQQVGPNGEALPPAPPPAPVMPPGLEQAQALIADFQQGMARHEQIKKIGKTLQTLFGQALRAQKPVDFKTAMKQMVRRTCTTAVGYVEIGFQRDKGPRPGLTEQLTDSRQRLDHLQHLQAEAQDGEIEDCDDEMFELQTSIASLQSEPNIVIREGLIFDFPQSTKVIPDKLTRTLVGFIGARHLTIEYDYTVDEAEELFPGIDFKKGSKGSGEDASVAKAAARIVGENEDGDDTKKGPKSTVCVWKYYDKPSGQVYFVSEGQKGFLRTPAPPDVFVDDFWPVYAVTFNAVESEDELYPPSDARLVLDMQNEHNRSRQGMREHREAARPRWGYTKGALDDDTIDALKVAKPFDAIAMNKDPQTPLKEILEPIPVPGVDPNLYSTAEFWNDFETVIGAQQALMGGVAPNVTATQSTIASNASTSSDSSSADDLDTFLSMVAQASGMILLKEMSQEQVMKAVGPGAVWPEATLPEIADLLYLEIAAGSSGKPNQAVEINNWQLMLPFLLQMPGIDKVWLARETIRRLDDRADLTEAIAAGMPSVVAQNQAQQPSTGNPATDPNAQGPQGGMKVPGPVAPGGSGPAFGSTHHGPGPGV